MTNLPRTVHLVTETPGTDAERLLKTVLTTHIRIVSISHGVTVLYQISCFFCASGTKIHRHHNLTAGTLCPLLELINTNLIGLDGTPGKLQTARTLCTVAGTVLPTITGNEITARITHQRHLHLLNHFHNITAEAHVIRSLMTRLINTAVHRTT